MNPSASRPGPSCFLRMGLSLGLKSPPERGKQYDEGWYIPYTGTYESPPEPQPPRNRDRDSWGDPIPGPSGMQAAGNNPHVHHDDAQEEKLSEENRERGHIQSISSNYTTLDHGRPEKSTKRKQYTNSQCLSAPSYSPDMTSVGRSPTPHISLPKERALSRRNSLASILTFGIRPFPSADRILKSPSRKRSSRPNTSDSADRVSNQPSSADHCRTTSGDMHSVCVKRGIMSPLQVVDSRTTTDEEYYDSYYSTLLQSPVKTRTPTSVGPVSSPGSELVTTSQHPYAIAFPNTEGRESTHRARQARRPPVLNLVSPPLQFSASEHVASNDLPPRQIKVSVSSPNLKSTKSPSNQSRNVPKGINRWLSAETWCDALFFPRPRLKMKNEKSNSVRIVSLPGSPVLPTGSSAQIPSVPSRVLAHSISLVNLQERTREEHRRQKFRGGPLLPSATTSQVRHQSGSEREQQNMSDPARLPRPKSWALDDLDLPSPVPSLAKVLAEGERLESERKQWRSQAEGSWGYKRARSVSRSRSRSLTASGRKNSSEVLSNLDFLTARAVHGNQDIIPALHPTSKHGRGFPSSKGAGSQSQDTSNRHSQMSSLIRSWTQSSRSPRDHSQDGSWSNPAAIKAVKPVTHAASMPKVEKEFHPHHSSQVHRSPKSAAQLIRQPAPAPIPLSLTQSPTPSSASDDADPLVGIAISAPFIDESLDRENLQLASHPYAQGGLYSFTPSSPVHEKRTEYAGPHPVQNIHPQEIPASPAARHRLPPHVILSHPYARAISSIGDSYDDRSIRNMRSDSDVPSHALALGIVHEMVRSDYPSLLSPNVNLEGDMPMTMAGIVDTVGVGEALAYANEYQGQKQRESTEDNDLAVSDSDILGGSVSGAVRPEVVSGQFIARVCSPSRMPVQYDVTRPSYRPQRKVPWTPETLDTLASSPLEHQYTPRLPEFIRTAKADFASSVLNSEKPLTRHLLRPRSPNDLDGFQEPHRMVSLGEFSLDGSPTRLSNIPFDLESRQRPTSSLASLAGKLNQDYEPTSTKERVERQYSQSSRSFITGSSRSPTTRQLKDASLEFLFEQPSQSRLIINEHGPTGFSLPFEPQENVPEDVRSMSSIETGKELETTESENETEVLHVKQVEVATPAEVDTDHRSSCAGQLGYHTGRAEIDGPQSVSTTAFDIAPVDYDSEVPSIYSGPTSPSPRIISGLLSPSSDEVRSSYSTSTMSGLSDFPIPPASHGISAFLNEATSQPPFSEEEDRPLELQNP